jgi:hypothetical protein
VQVTVSISSMLKKELLEEFFARSRGKGSIIKSEIVNGSKVKKDL